MGSIGNGPGSVSWALMSLTGAGFEAEPQLPCGMGCMGCTGYTACASFTSCAPGYFGHSLRLDRPEQEGMAFFIRMTVNQDDARIRNLQHTVDLDRILVD